PPGGRSGGPLALPAVCRARTGGHPAGAARFRLRPGRSRTDLLRSPPEQPAVAPATAGPPLPVATAARYNPFASRRPPTPYDRSPRHEPGDPHLPVHLR